MFVQDIRSRVALLSVAVCALALPALAQAQGPVQGPSLPPLATDPYGSSGPEADTREATPERDATEPRSGSGAEARAGGKPDANLKVWMRGLSGGRLDAGDTVKALGSVVPFVPGQKVRVAFKRGKKIVKTKKVFIKRKPGTNRGEFFAGQRFTRPGVYRIVASHKETARQKFGKANTKTFKLRFPSLSPGQSNKDVRLLNDILEREGYVPSKGDTYSSRTQRAVLAFRKTNNLSRSSTSMTSKMFKKLAAGKGSYRVKRPDMGRHVEADLSRQIMVLVDDGEPKEIYHVSTGKPSTPTYPGTWNFLRREPGLNNVGMYYSVYYNGGYAIHGYKSVPTYPASAGCLRNPTPDSKHIYDWVSIGMPIHITR